MALDSLSFNIPEGCITGFLGANGAGKTTSLKILMNFINTNSGEVEYSRALGSTWNEIVSNIGFLPERPYFYPHLTGLEFIHYMGDLCGVKRSTIAERSAKWGERFKIRFAFDRKIRGYSKGMLQRLGYVISLIHDPQLVIFDEPLSGLDPVGRKELKDAMREINDLGKTVFFSSHIISDVEEVCDQVIFIEKGKLVYQGQIDQLIKSKMKSEVLFKVKCSPEKLTAIGIDSFAGIGDGKFKFTTLTIDQNKTIRNLLASEISILELSPKRPTLEEVIYKVGEF
ncbi:MAG: ABC transporter ATP-binding protein [Bacteriovoracaceae bacterium]|nr:ABC transporter ATP-binding protein [Bacteriovoracaceae bacterium]